MPYPIGLFFLFHRFFVTQSSLKTHATTIVAVGQKRKKDAESAEKLLLAGGYQLAVESVALGLNTAFGKSRLHRAAGLGRVRAVVKAAAVHTGGNVRHSAQDVELGEVRQTELLEPGAGWTNTKG